MGTRMSALRRGLRDKPQASCEGGLGSDGQPASANQIRQAVRTHTHTHTHTHTRQLCSSQFPLLFSGQSPSLTSILVFSLVLVKRAEWEGLGGDSSPAKFSQQDNQGF